MGTIQNVSVAQDVAQAWGINVYEYKMDNRQVDFQDLMIAVSEKRAVTVEGEVVPMTQRIRARNKYLDDLGAALSELTKIQASFDNDDSGSRDMKGDWMTDTTGSLLENKLGFSCSHYSSKPTSGWDNDERPGFYYGSWGNSDAHYSANKMTIEGMIQKVKSTIDGLNNQSQTDMSRLQSLVDRRDESYSTATNLMTNVSDTRGNLIRNL
ncbi:MAG: hypothetical protein IJR99_08920 [Kiritimatiellae bacterium]|nr:hypothetical protein [Kiritimatiellia bacterium]